MATDTLPHEAPAATTAWAEAFAQFNKVNAAFDEAINRHAEAEEAAGDEHPREDRFFVTYGLGMGMSRQRVLDTLDWRNRITGKEAEAIADEFMAYQERSREVDRRHGIDELDKRIEELREPWRAAREALMAIPAPDTDGLLVKLEIAFASLCTDHADNALADAKRLLQG